MQAAGDAAELLVDEEPLEHRPSLAAVLAAGRGRRAAARRSPARLISATVSSGRRPPRRSASSSSGIRTSRRTRGRGSSRAARVSRGQVTWLISSERGPGAAGREPAVAVRAVSAAPRPSSRAAGCGGWRSPGARAQRRHARLRDRRTASAVDQLHHVVQVARAIGAGRRRSTSRSIRSRSAATAAAPARPPGGQRRHRLPGSSRSGSGVIDSQVARLTMAGRLTSTDHKVRMRTMEPPLAPPASVPSRRRLAPWSPTSTSIPTCSAPSRS